MPVMSGIESTRAIRSYEQERALRLAQDGKPGEVARKSFVIALTGLAAASDQREAFAAGVDYFMVKPVNFKELEKILVERCGGL